MATGHYHRSKVNFGIATCPGCGKVFRRVINRQVFRTSRCREVARNIGRVKPKTCASCGRKFTRGEDNFRRHTCAACQDTALRATEEEQERRVTVRPRNLQRTCLHCGTQFVANRGQQKDCGNDCKSRARRDREREVGISVPSMVACETCGTTFHQSRVYQRFCSKEAGEAIERVLGT